MDGLTVTFLIAGMIGLGGICITLFDKGLRWKDRP